MSDNPQSPRSHLENVANHLAWRRTSHVTNLVAIGALGCIAIFVSALIRHPAAYTGAGISLVVALIVGIVDRVHAQHLKRRPVAHEFVPPSSWGMASRTSALTSIGIVAVIVGGLTGFAVVSDGAKGWVMLWMGLPLWLFVVALAVPGLVIRSKRWALLTRALSDPRTAADLRHIRDTYPPFARIPFAAPSDGVRLP